MVHNMGEFQNSTFDIFIPLMRNSEHVEICNACWKHIEKECWKSMLKISECSENCNACCVFKISAHVEKHVEILSMFWKL